MATPGENLIQCVMQKPERNAARILIVDADKESAGSLSKILESLGYLAHSSHDPVSAGALMKSVHPDLVLYSLKMGVNLVASFRDPRMDSNGGLPVLGLIDASTLSVKRAAFDAGVRDFLTAPYDSVDVEARVKSVLQVRELQKRTQYLATHDPLTRCVNRASLVDFLTRELERTKRFKKPFIFLLLDMDGLSDINKRMGQPMGDQALVHVGYRLQDFFRAVDCVARLDGDQFAAVLPDSGLSAAMKVGDRLMADLLSPESRPPLPKTLKGKLQFSVGISCAPDHGETVDSIFLSAEKALAQVKKAGGGKFRVYTNKTH